MTTPMPAHKYLKPEDIRRLANYEFGAKAMVEGYLSGRHRSKQRGSSTEFHEFRQYSLGDDLSKVKGIAFVKNGKVECSPARPFIEDLDSLSPAWHLVNWSDYPLYFIDDSTVAIVSSSRGCIHSCLFCSQHKFWQGSYRERDPYKFVSEIEHLATAYGINVFFIADEYPTRSRERWEKILDLLIEKQLGVHILMETCVPDIIRDQDILHRYRQAGILFIYLGVEATNDRKLEEFKKENKFEDSKEALRLVADAGMIVESSLIIGTPNETPESIKETLEVAYDYNADFGGAEFYPGVQTRFPQDAL